MLYRVPSYCPIVAVRYAHTLPLYQLTRWLGLYRRYDKKLHLGCYSFLQ